MASIIIAPIIHTYVTENFPGDTRDAYLYSAVGQVDLITGFGSTYEGVCRTWLTFDISAIPVGSTITTAELGIGWWMSSGNYADKTVNVNRCTDVSFNSGITWNTAPNASVSATPSGTVFIGGGNAGGSQTVTGLMADVAASLADGILAYRLSSANEGDGNGAYLSCRRWTPDPESPFMGIAYTPPVAGSRRRSTVVFVK